MRLIPPLPADWQATFTQLTDTFSAALDAAQIPHWQSLLESPECYQSLAQFWLGSQYAFEWSCREPTWLLELAGSPLAQQQPSAETLAQALANSLSTVTQDTEWMTVLRHFRHRTMLHILWRDFTRLANTLETTAALSALADVCIRCAVDFHYPRLCQEVGTPCNEQGVAQTLLVLAMGKLGAHELNLSSDIDLIFAYNDSGDTLINGVRSPRSVSNRDFFLRLGQRVIQALDKHTADGFVFRVDMRLRPYGDSGALALNYDAMEQYYQQQGRDWERYAMIKARLVCGDPTQAAPLLDLLRRFTFRRYLDFSAIASLRELKHQIAREVAKKGMQDNIKLGWGGIREIEFIVQAFQLIHGGRDRDLQPAPVIPMIGQLASKQFLSSEDADALCAAYFFLRDIEHLIQGWRDEQTQMLPTDDTRLQRMAWLMGFHSWADCHTALQHHREQVQRLFNAVIAPATDEHNTASNPWLALWNALTDEDSSAAESLAPHCAELPALLQQLHAWRHDKSLLTLPTEGRERLHRFMPLLLPALWACDKPAATFERLLPLLRAVLRRSAYLVLLMENPHALQQLVLLVQASSWIAEQLAAWPVLLDELIDPRNLYRDVAPSRELLRELLHAQLQHIPADDIEARMDALRHFKRSHALRAAACEVTERLPLMKVSDYLTFMAEVLLEHVLDWCWHALVARHGCPRREDGSRCDPGFIIVGYGKLGGLELGHGSDLDLVFIHAAGSGETDADPAAGQVPLDNSQFFARLGQKIIHVLNTRTVNGILYEVDVRLRPSGNSGLLVASLRSFERYQEQDAWTWEHQALVRARVVAGCPQLAAGFADVRARVLGAARDIGTLRHAVIEMRQKMRTQLDRSNAQHFDLKHGLGGIVDLEFLVQFAVLAWSHEHPALLIWPDNIRILEQLAAASLLPAPEADALMEAYRQLRARGHRRTLLGEPTLIGIDELQPERNTVLRAWQAMLGE